MLLFFSSLYRCGYISWWRYFKINKMNLFDFSMTINVQKVIWEKNIIKWKIISQEIYGRHPMKGKYILYSIYKCMYNCPTATKKWTTHLNGYLWSSSLWWCCNYTIFWQRSLTLDYIWNSFVYAKWFSKIILPLFINFLHMDHFWH